MLKSAHSQCTPPETEGQKLLKLPTHVFSESQMWNILIKDMCYVISQLLIN